MLALALSGRRRVLTIVSPVPSSVIQVFRGVFVPGALAGAAGCGTGFARFFGTIVSCFCQILALVLGCLLLFLLVVWRV